MLQMNKSKLSIESDMTKKSAPSVQHFFVHDHSLAAAVAAAEVIWDVEEAEVKEKLLDTVVEGVEKRSRREMARHNIDNSKSM